MQQKQSCQDVFSYQTNFNKNTKNTKNVKDVKIEIPKIDETKISIDELLQNQNQQIKQNNGDAIVLKTEQNEIEIPQNKQIQEIQEIIQNPNLNTRERATKLVILFVSFIISGLIGWSIQKFLN